MNIGLGIGIGRPVAMAGGGMTFLLRDLFTTDRAAGAVNATAAEPGPGTRAVTDLDSRITIADDLLKIAAAGSAGDRTAFWLTPSITRAPGIVVAFDYISPASGGNVIQFGLAVATGASLNHHINSGLRSLGAIAIHVRRTATAESPKIAVTSVGTTYRIYQVLRAVGQFVFLKTGSTVKFLWADELDATPDLYLSVISNGVLASHYGNVAAPGSIRYSFDVSSSDSFNRANGAPGNTDGLGHAEGGSGDGLAWADQVGNATIASNALILSTLAGGVGIVTVDTGNTDEFVAVEGTRAGGALGVVTRYVDANNYIVAYHDGTDFKIDKVVAGVTTNVGSKTITIAASGKIKVKCDGTSVWGWYDDKDVDMEPLTIADAALQTGTKHGVYSTNVGNTFDDWFTVPVNGYADLGAY